MPSIANPQGLPCTAHGTLSCCRFIGLSIDARQKLYPVGLHKCRMKLLPNVFIKGHKFYCGEKYFLTRNHGGWRGIVARIEMSNPDDYDVGRLLGSYGYMNITSYAAEQSRGLSATGMFENSGAGLSQKDIEKLKGQEVGEGNLRIRLYSGRVSRGPRMGTRVIFKAYPGRLTGGVEADVMAANELATHAFLQDVPDEDICPNLQILLGGFQTRTGEQWLVFRDDGRITAANYAKAAIEATTEGRAVGEWEFWDRFDRSQPIKRRQIFIIKLLRGAFTGLSYLHSRDRLHQSLGPASIILNTIEERDVRYLVPRLRDLAFAVDIRVHISPGNISLYFNKRQELVSLLAMNFKRESIVLVTISDRAIFGAKDIGFSSIRPSSSVSSGDISLETAAEAQSEGLWRRAVSSGAFTPLEKKAFGISDDIYAAGLLLAYMAFIPLCEKGSIDGPSLQRLLESTFQLDIQAVREYCQADDRWSEAVNFLDLDNRAGWELLQAMLNPDFRLRPTAQAVLSHRFMTRIL